jgi:ankyrin repeat protein
LTRYSEELYDERFSKDYDKRISRFLLSIGIRSSWVDVSDFEVFVDALEMDCPTNILEDILDHFFHSGHGHSAPSVCYAILKSYQKGHFNIFHLLVRHFDINMELPFPGSPPAPRPHSIFVAFIYSSFHPSCKDYSRWHVLDVFLSNGADVDTDLIAQTYVHPSCIRWYNKNGTNRALRPTILDCSFRFNRSLFMRLAQYSKVPKTALTKTGLLISLEKGPGALRDYLRTREPAIDLFNWRIIGSLLRFLLDDQLDSGEWGSCMELTHNIDFKTVRNLFQYADDMNWHTIFLPRINSLLNRVIHQLLRYPEQFTDDGWQLLDVLVHKGGDITDRHLQFAVELEGIIILNWLRPRVKSFSARATGALAQAVRLRNFQAVQFLVQSGVDPKASVDLSEAVQQNDSAVRVFLAQRGVHWSAPAAFAAALSVPARQNNFELVEFLVQSGVDPKDPAALAIAARQNNFEVVEFLLQRGASPNVFISAQIAKLAVLKEIHFNITAQGSQEQVYSLQAIAAGFGAVSSDERSSLRMFRFLAERGAKFVIGPNDTTPFAFIMLLLETGRGDPELFAKIKFVLSTLKQSIRQAKPPAFLLEMCAWGRGGTPDKEGVKIFEYLLDGGADVNHGSPLAALINSEAPKELVERVLDLGAKLDAYTAIGSSVSDATRTPLQAAASRGNEDLVYRFLEQGANINSPARGRYGRTALQAICSWNPATEKEHRRKMTICDVLLNSGAEVNAAPASHGGMTALQATILNGDLELAEILIRNGADVNGPPYRSNTGNKGHYFKFSVLDLAAQCGRLDIAELLLNANAVSGLPGITGYDGAINLAQHHCHHAVASLISEHLGNSMKPEGDLLSFWTAPKDYHSHGHYTDCESTDDEYRNERQNHCGSADSDSSSANEESPEGDSAKYDPLSEWDSLASPATGDLAECAVDIQWDTQPLPDSFMGALTEILDAEAFPDLQVVANAPTDDGFSHSGTGFILPAEYIQLPGNEWMLRDPFEAGTGMLEESTLWQQVFDMQDEEFGFASFDPSCQLTSSAHLGKPDIEGQDAAERDFVQ